MRRVYKHKKSDPVTIGTRTYYIDSLLGSDLDKLRYVARECQGRRVALMDAGGVVLCPECAKAEYRTEYRRAANPPYTEYAIYEAGPGEEFGYICEACLKSI